MTTVELLEAALNTIKTRGLVTHQFRNINTGAVCPVMAMRMQFSVDPHYARVPENQKNIAVYDAATNVFMKANNIRSIIGWADDRHRPLTQEMVEAAFERAISVANEPGSNIN